MSNYRILLFDLDGTISDPKEGITKSVQYALQKMGINEPDLEKLTPFIGPPLQVSFKEFYGFSNDQTDQAIAYYRERFKEKGMFENVLYEGIPALLAKLKDDGYRLAIATSKLTSFSEEILRYFKIQHFFEVIVGSNLDGTRSDKADVISYLLDYYNDYVRADMVMIGDRKYDIIGAQINNIESIGVTYGYGSKEELTAAKATYIVHSIDELQAIIE